MIARWEDYAADAGTEQAGRALDAEILGAICENRAAIPVEPKLKPTTMVRGGHVYGGGGDAAHAAYLEQWLGRRAASASPLDQRRIMAFRALLRREGSTTAINTYDRQIVTWGVGFSGFGSLGRVMGRATANEAVRALFCGVGMRCRGSRIYDVVDVETGLVVTGTAPALEIVRGSAELLHTLIHAARDGATRDAVTGAQLTTFLETSAVIPGAEAVATQALFNLLVHLNHWLPAYMIGALAWAVPRAGEGGPSAERDKKLAALCCRYFYGKARRGPIAPDYKQLAIYWEHMKADGLDCLDDPFFRAGAPPSDDPFAA